MRDLDTEIINISSVETYESYPVLMGVCQSKNMTAENIQRTFIAISSACQGDADGEVAIVTTGMLNSPDKVSANGRRLDENSFELNIEINQYAGPMAANVPWQALIKMQLGALEKRTYELIVYEKMQQFTDMKNPEQSSNITTNESSMKFICS